MNGWMKSLIGALSAVVVMLLGGGIAGVVSTGIVVRDLGRDTAALLLVLTERVDVQSERLSTLDEKLNHLIITANRLRVEEDTFNERGR